MTAPSKLVMEIKNCQHVINDIDMLFEAVVEYNLTQDQISNILLGMLELYRLRFDKLNRTLEDYQ